MDISDDEIFQKYIGEVSEKWTVVGFKFATHKKLQTNSEFIEKAMDIINIAAEEEIKLVINCYKKLEDLSELYNKNEDKTNST